MFLIGESQCRGNYLCENAYICHIFCKTKTCEGNDGTKSKEIHIIYISQIGYCNHSLN